jgi:hypothetical protein
MWQRQSVGEKNIGAITIDERAMDYSTIRKTREN